MSLRLAGGGARRAAPSSTRPRRRQTKSARPVASETIPGTKKAARQPERSISAPAVTPASAMPTLPNTPLMPSARPGWSALFTSQGMPTGW